MRLGIDIDNTISNLTESIARELDPIMKCDTQPLLLESYSIGDVTGWNDDRVQAFHDFYDADIFFFAGLKDEYTKALLKGLFLRHIDMFILSEREDDKEGMTIAWLAANDLYEYFNDVYFTPCAKYTFNVDKGLQLDAIIEDRLEDAIPFLEANIPVVLFDYPYNSDYTHPKLHRVSNWWEAFQAVIEIQNEMGKQW